MRKLSAQQWMALWQECLMTVERKQRISLLFRLKGFLQYGISNPEETGIIAPYKNQVEALAQEFHDIDAATVHKFQGKEKDTIIISTVDDEISDFADDPYLINVAVSRAKKKLMLVVTGNEQTKERNITDLIAYIQYNNLR